MEFGTLGKGLTKEKKEQIEALKLPGISFITENARVYPNGDFASYVIGHARPDEQWNRSRSIWLRKEFG